MISRKNCVQIRGNEKDNERGTSKEETSAVAWCPRSAESITRPASLRLKSDNQKGGVKGKTSHPGKVEYRGAVSIKQRD